MSIVTMETRKRTISEDDVLGAAVDQKRPRMSFYIRLESESSLDSQDDTESVYSIQDKETDVVQDTSDTDSDSDLGSSSELDTDSISDLGSSGAELLAIEYDVASLSSGGEFPDYSSSGTEDQNMQAVAEGAFAAMLFDTSVDRWETDGDTSDGSTIFDAFDFVVCRKDFGTCQQCHLHNDNPSYRYCEKCFQKCWQCKTMMTFKGFPLCSRCFKVRKTFFPPRPRPSRKRKHHDESRKRQQHAETLQHFLNSLEQAGGSATDGDGEKRIPDLNFGDIVVPQLQQLAASQASTRTHDAGSDSDSDLFDDDGDDRAAAMGAPRRKRCKIDSAAATDTTATLTSSQSDDDACKNSSTSKPSIITTTSAGESEPCSQDSGIGVKLTCASQETNDALSQASSSSTTLVDDGVGGTPKTVAAAGDGGAIRDTEMCIMCTSAPKNSVFLHGSIGHRCCCYKCAMRVWSSCKRCPVCNCKVKNVIKVFTS